MPATDRWSTALDLPLTRKRNEALAERERLFAAMLGIQMRREGGAAPIPGWEGTPFTGRMQGTAMTWNNRTFIGAAPWGFYEELDPHSADRAAREDDVILTIEHDPGKILGRTTARTLTLTPDARGLRSNADMAPTTLGKDTAILLQRGDLNAMSFRFRTNPSGEQWSTVTDAQGRSADLCRHTDLLLRDVSLVAFPAYQGTDAGVRSEQLDARGNVSADTRELDELELLLLIERTKA